MTPVGDNRVVTVAWSAPADPAGQTVASFTGSTTTVAKTVTAAAAATSVTVTGLTNGTAYSFKVNAVYGTTNGATSARSSTVTPAVG